MIRVGVTGGIGSGKSLVCRVFEKLGIPVYDADLAAREIMDHDPGIRNDLTAWLGDDIYRDGKLDRPRMAGLVFNDADMLQTVNRIVHPRVAVDFENWCGAVTDKPYVIQESAILFESGAYRIVDRVILVTAPEPVRIDRVMNRNGMTADRVRAIMKNQSPDWEKAGRSHYLINNDNRNLILPAILEIHAALAQTNQSPVA